MPSADPQWSGARAVVPIVLGTMPAHVSTPIIGAALAGALLLLAFAACALHSVREYERLLVFRFGRLLGARGPGLVLTIPLADRVRSISLRVDTVELAPLDVLTGDDVDVRVKAAILYRIVDPIRAVVSIRDYEQALVRIAQATMRATLGRYERPALLAGRTTINGMLTEVVDAAIQEWGLKVERLQIEDIEILGERGNAARAPEQRGRRQEPPTVEPDVREAESDVREAEPDVRAAEPLQLPSWM